MMSNFFAADAVSAGGLTPTAIVNVGRAMLQTRHWQ